jgi:hypothetical protein
MSRPPGCTPAHGRAARRRLDQRLGSPSEPSDGEDPAGELGTTFEPAGREGATGDVEWEGADGASLGAGAGGGFVRRGACTTGAGGGLGGLTAVRVGCRVTVGVLAALLVGAAERREELERRAAGAGEVEARRRVAWLRFFVALVALACLGAGLGVALGSAACWTLAVSALFDGAGEVPNRPMEGTPSDPPTVSVCDSPTRTTAAAQPAAASVLAAVAPKSCVRDLRAIRRCRRSARTRRSSGSHTGGA